MLSLMQFIFKEMKELFEALKEENPNEDYKESIEFFKNYWLELYGIKWEMPNAWLKLSWVVTKVCANVKRELKCKEEDLKNCDLVEITKTIETIYTGVGKNLQFMSEFEKKNFFLNVQVLKSIFF